MRAKRRIGWTFRRGSSARGTKPPSGSLDNAFKYSDERGTVSVSLSKKGEKRTLSVTNTGKGISAEEQKHIFERFYRSDASRSRQPDGGGQSGGYGLGLAIAASIVAAHGGRISVRSDGQSQTTITAVL